MKLLPTRLAPIFQRLERLFTRLDEDQDCESRRAVAMATVANALLRLVQAGALEERIRVIEAQMAQETGRPQRWPTPASAPHGAPRDVAPHAPHVVVPDPAAPAVPRGEEYQRQPTSPPAPAAPERRVPAVTAPEHPAPAWQLAVPTPESEPERTPWALPPEQAAFEREGQRWLRAHGGRLYVK